MSLPSTFPKPGRDLLDAVRAAFILKGTTMTRWCRENNRPQANARLCLLGAWDGPKGRALRDELIKASGAADSIIHPATRVAEAA